MSIGVTALIIIGLVAAIWIIIEMKRMKHKLFAIFLIALILFAYFTITVAFSGKQLDLKSFQGFLDAGKIYFAWLGGFFSNVKSFSAKVIQNLKGNSTLK